MGARVGNRGPWATRSRRQTGRLPGVDGGPRSGGAAWIASRCAARHATSEPRERVCMHDEATVTALGTRRRKATTSCQRHGIEARRALVGETVDAVQAQPGVHRVQRGRGADAPPPRRLGLPGVAPALGARCAGRTAERRPEGAPIVTRTRRTLPARKVRDGYPVGMPRHRGDLVRRPAQQDGAGDHHAGPHGEARGLRYGAMSVGVRGRTHFATGKAKDSHRDALLERGVTQRSCHHTRTRIVLLSSTGERPAAIRGVHPPRRSRNEQAAAEITRTRFLDPSKMPSPSASAPVDRSRDGWRPFGAPPSGSQRRRASDTSPPCRHFCRVVASCSCSGSPPPARSCRHAATATVPRARERARCSSSVPASPA